MAKRQERIKRREFLKVGGTGLAGLASAPFGAEPNSDAFQDTASRSSAAVSYEEQVKRQRQPVRSVVDEVPVYAFGDTFFYGASPDLAKGSRLQNGTNAPVRRIHPKKSWEITSNKMGATSPRVPRTELNDYQPYVGVHLIDGDPETYWMSRGQNQPDVEHVWVGIDLPKETCVKATVLIPRADNQGMPEDFTIQVSRDAWHWETVHENRNYAVPRDTPPRVFPFEPRLVKQIPITARKCTEVDVPAPRDRRNA